MISNDQRNNQQWSTTTQDNIKNDSHLIGVIHKVIHQVIHKFIKLSYFVALTFSIAMEHPGHTYACMKENVLQMF